MTIRDRVQMDTRQQLPFETLPGPLYRPMLGTALVVGGVLSLVVRLLIPTLMQFATEASSLEAFIVEEPVFAVSVAAVVGVAVFGGVYLVAVGRQMHAVPADQVLCDRSATPVLFLRSFDDDDLVDPTPRMIPMGDLFPRRYEESFEAALRRLGPLVAIGRPGSALSELGSRRFYVPDHAWKDAVDFVRRRASAVLFVVGRTEGLWWEIETSLRDVPAERLLFFFPYVEEPGRRRSFWQKHLHWAPSRLPFSSAAFRRMESERRARYRAFRQRLEPRLTWRLPPDLGEAQFMDFEATGEPRLLQTRRPWWSPLAFHLPSSRRMIIDVKRTLRPFVEKSAHDD